MARPTKFNQEILDKAKHYLDVGFMEQEEVVPTIVGLAGYINIARSTVYEWAEEHKAFSDTLDDINAKQQRILVSKGLTGDFNATIAKLMLSNHGVNETTVQDHKSSDGSMKPTVVQLVGKDDE
jgi:hypothetical protein